VKLTVSDTGSGIPSSYLPHLFENFFRGLDLPNLMRKTDYHALARFVPAELIDHTAQRNPQPAPGPTLAYGEYIAEACKFCHGQNLGGQPVGGEANAPPSPPIGPNSVVSRWTEAQFVQTMRSGVTPEGRTLRPQFMPWPAVGALHDDELHALYTYLHQLPQQTAMAK